MEKFSKNYEIASFESDRNGVLRLRTLFNLFQDLADGHATVMGVGYHACVQHGIGWIGGAYHVRIHRMPRWEDKVTFLTWPSAATAVTGIREFQVQDENGQVLIEASSQWVLIDTQKLRPVAVTKYFGSYEVIAQRAVETGFEKLPPLDCVDYQADEIIRYDDIDINGHVNNAVYPTWALDGLPADFIRNRQLTELKIQFKKSARLGDSIHLQTQIEADKTRHLITNADGSVEFARLELHWT